LAPANGTDKPSQYITTDAATAALLLHIDQETAFMSGTGALLYRGQAHVPEWGIQPSIDRPHEKAASLYGARILGSRLFDLVLRRIDWQASAELTKGWQLTDSETAALGRHHGMLSPLIDLTVDPSVAVAFAHDQAMKEKSEYACVFQITTRGLGSNSLLTIPPPPFLRSVRQLGVYLKVPEPVPDPVRLQSGSVLMICFPTNSEPIHENTYLLRDGTDVDFMHADPLLHALEVKIKSLIETLPVAAIQEEMSDPLPYGPNTLKIMSDLILYEFAKIGLVSKDGERFRYRAEASVLPEWFGLTTDLIYSLVFMSKERQGMAVDLDLLDDFVRANYISMQIYLRIFAEYCPGTPLESHRPMVRYINTKLLEISSGNVGIYSKDLILEGTSITPGNVNKLPWPVKVTAD
jgi:hypothetical protein